MSKSATDVAVFPGGMTTAAVAGDKPNPSIVVLTPDDHDEVIVRYILGDSCRLSACLSLRDLANLVNKSSDTPPDLIFVRDLLLQKDPKFLKGVMQRVQQHTPVLVLGDKVGDQDIARYMESGAHDAVSLEGADRLRSVVRRELENHRIRCAYESVDWLATRYQRQLERLNQPTYQSASHLSQAVTRVRDRESFLEQLAKRLATTLSRGVRVLVWIRPDRFSALQSSVGVVASEEALAHINSVLQDLLHPADLCGRFGGTVFTALVERGTLKDVEAWVQQFSRSLNERPFVNAGKSVSLSCAVGLYETAVADESIERILQEAHNACHRGRLQGDGQICLSSSSKSARSIRLRDKKWAARLRHALQDDRFRLVQSPVVRLDGRDEKIRDTWVRMIDEKGNTILPAEFVPVAKRVGLMIHIDRWVIAATMTYCTKRDPDLVFVRLSRNSMLDDSLANWLKKIFEKSPVKPCQICYQTTETVAARHMMQTIRQIKELTKLGFHFAIEQVGATPETMEVLQAVPMQYARIDAALLQQVAWNRLVRKQVSQIVSTAKDRGIHAIAERVEDAASMAVLCRMDVELMQGDYFWRDNITMEDTVTVCLPKLQPANT